jgi:hypothetical protein
MVSFLSADIRRQFNDYWRLVLLSSLIAMYADSIRIGTHVNAAFYNIDPENSFEFFPKKDGGKVRPSAFLERSLPANLFPR